ncbi:MAG: hypothetical protein JXB30_10780 [Anaerolineae bacterium]|nr:hypothetical protein [Anaerolineae bacterium]
MRRVSVGAAILVVFSLTACGSLRVEGEVFKAADITPQKISRFSPLELSENSSNQEIGEVILGDEPGRIKPTSEFTATPAPDEDSTTTPVSDTVSTPEAYASTSAFPTSPISSPLPGVTSPTSTDEILSETFWPDPGIPREADSTWDFGASLDFSSSTQTKVSFLAFGMYSDEAKTSAGADACVTSQGQMPPTHPERPFWSSGTEKTYPAGRHTFEQAYHYTDPSTGITRMALWLIQRKNGQVAHCSVQQYILLPGSEISVHSQQFFPNTDDVIDRNSMFDFGVELSFANSGEFRTMLLAFPIYADETVPASGTCLSRQGSMPTAHPDRPFWGADTEEFYTPGLSQTFSQTYRYSEPVPGTTHLILWLILRQDAQVRYCAQQVYTLSPE